MGTMRLSFLISTLFFLVLISILALADQIDSSSGITGSHKVLQLGSQHTSQYQSNFNGSNIPGTQTVTVYNIASESGQVRSNRSVNQNLIVGSVSNIMSQAMLSFDISSIPAGSIIRNVAIDFRQSEVIGDPFLNLGCLKVYRASYEKIDPGCYYKGLSYEGLIKVCSLDDFLVPKSYDALLKSLQDSVGASRFQIRMQFDEKGAGLGENYLSTWGDKQKTSEATSWDESMKEVCGENPFKDIPATGNPPAGVTNNAIKYNSVALQITFSPPNGNSSSVVTSNAQQSNKTNDENNVIEELERLAKLKDEGVLSDDEFQAQKKKILNT
jgi:hypothetical protein